MTDAKIPQDEIRIIVVENYNVLFLGKLLIIYKWEIDTVECE